MLAHGGAGVGDGPPGGGSSLQRNRGCARGRADEGMESPQSWVPPSQVPQSMVQTGAAKHPWLWKDMCGSEQSCTDTMEQSHQPILVKLLHANTNTVNGS